MWTNNLERLNFKMEEIRVFDAFAGIGSLHKSLGKLGVPKRITNLAEVDIDAIISYSGVHIENFKNLEFEYPSDEYMREWLMDRKIGYDFEKGKSKIPRLKKDKLKYLFKGSYLLNNLGDISSIDPEDIEDFDIFNLSFCCQDISNAGKQKGLRNEDGTPTRSGLIVPSLKLARAKKPKYIMIENVKALIQKKFIDDFYDIINELIEMGYNCYYPTKEDKKGNKLPTCLNSKNFGVAQNRERIFVYAIRKDIDDYGFEFDYGYDRGIRLKHMLEDYVEEKYYLSDEIQKRFTPFPSDKLNNEDIEVLRTTTLNPKRDDGNLIYDKCTSAWVYNRDKLCGTLSARDYNQPKQIIDNVLVSKEYDLAEKTKRFFIDNSFNMETKGNGFRFDPHIKDNANTAKCITTRAGSRMDDNFIMYEPNYNSETFKFDTKNELIDRNNIEYDKFKIRKLTPLECWRLQGFDDEDFYKAKELGVSDSQLYKQAGNSITVNVLYYQFKNLFKKYIVK